jgi:hypothetical protein
MTADKIVPIKFLIMPLFKAGWFSYILELVCIGLLGFFSRVFILYSSWISAEANINVNRGLKWRGYGNQIYSRLFFCLLHRNGRC